LARISEKTDVHENFTRDISLDKKVPLSFGSRRICLGGGLHSASALVMSSMESCLCFIQ